MRCRFELEHPNEIEATLIATMTIKDWCGLRDQLQNHWPSSDLVSHINNVLSKTRRILWSD